MDDKERASQVLHDLFESYKHTSSYMDHSKMEIIARKVEFEERLDKMWANFRHGNMQQVVDYKRQVAYIKEAGLVVIRHKTNGKHRITYG